MSEEHRGGGPDAASPGVQDGPSLLPPRTAFLELIVLIGLIVGVDWLVVDVAVMQLQPHPFWLPVLVLSLQYGTVSGLFAAIVAILITAFGYPWPEQENGENLYAYAARTFTQPVLWIAAAVMLGQFRVRQIETKRSLVRAVDILTHQREQLASYATGLRARCDALERDIVSRSEPPALQALAALETLQAGARYHPQRALIDGLAAVFPGASGCIVCRHGNRTVVVAQTSEWRMPANPVDLERLLVAVVDRGRQLDMLTAEGEAELGRVAMVAVPVPDGAGRIGALVIDRLRPSQVSPYTIAAAQSLARALSPSLTLASAAGHPSVVPLIPVTTPVHRTVPLDVAKASRRWGRFGWLPGRTRGHIVADPHSEEAAAAAAGRRPAAAKR